MSKEDKRISAIEFIARCKTAKDMCIGNVEGLDNGITLITTLQEGGFTVQLENDEEQKEYARALFLHPVYRMFKGERQFNLTPDTMLTLLQLRPDQVTMADDGSFCLEWN